MSTLFFASTCCQLSATLAKQMCSSHSDRWPLLIMLIHNKGDFTFFLANYHNSLAIKLPNKKMEGEICKQKKNIVRLFWLYLECVNKLTINREGFFFQEVLHYLWSLMLLCNACRLCLVVVGVRLGT